jgi:hypothetical protein
MINSLVWTPADLLGLTILDGRGRFTVVDRVAARTSTREHDHRHR